MIKIINAEQMRELDSKTLQSLQIPSVELMERAAGAVADFILNRWTVSTPVVVFAGPGNNGGDALAVARMLNKAGYIVKAYLFNIGDKLSNDCAHNKERINETEGLEFYEVTTQFEPPKLTLSTLVVDGLFGIGLHSNLSGGFASLVRFINDSPAEVVSIDMPSGLMCEDNSYNVRAHIIRANHTLTFQLPKLAQLLADNSDYTGQLHCLDIGLSPSAIEELPCDYTLIEETDMRNLLKPRNAFAHKGTFGHALIIAGKYGMAGAAILSARACLRSGVGKLTIHTPQKNNNVLQTAVPEAILSHDESDTIFTRPVISDAYNAVAIGCGIGTERTTALAFIEQVRHARVPLLIDADGINILSAHKGWMQQIPAHSILTPHPGEFRRLGVRSTDSFATFDEARETAMRYGLYIVLKGHYTAILTPEGKVFFNPTGNSGMATAGSGDVLTGVITALLAEKYPAITACRLGVFLHGLAGDIAAQDIGEDALTASDIIAYLPAAFRKLRETKQSSH